MLSSFDHSCNADDDHVAVQCNTNKQVDQSTQLLDDNASGTRKKLNGRQVNIKSMHHCITAHSALQCKHTMHPVSVNCRLAVKVKVESSALRDI